MTDSVNELIFQLQDLQIQQTTALQRLIVAQAKEACSGEGTVEDRTEEATFCIGYRIEIINTVRAPFGQSINSGDRQGIVTKITAKRVCFGKASGTKGT
eukprot:CAMPEP_0119010662 /NCGR_PEP_ID=MMETSP1176-20130426/5164_1 /TAXON_ID=265551 /ORGANISM="Synedropsis recta cf, Strain CCMP1620" /LENGTH=98 /DNA_ID=CAMNT_0006963369 /DNA_START=166 /DNA_END=462 /DNA_ORIENTATION=-